MTRIGAQIKTRSIRSGLDPGFVAGADLTLTAVGPTGPVGPDREFDYTITVANQGPDPVAGVVLLAALPEGLAFVASEPSTIFDESTRTLLIPVGVRPGLDPGASRVVTVTVRPTAALAGRAIGTTFTVSASGVPDPDPSNNVDSTSFNPTIIADLALTKTASPAQVAAGGTVTYTIVVTNNGTSDAVNAVLKDALPTGLTVVTAAATSGSCTTTSTDVTCTWPTLAEGASSTVTVQALVAADAPAGTVTNTASVASPAEDSNPANNSDSADVEVVQSADISVVKTADATAVARAPGAPA